MNDRAMNHRVMNSMEDQKRCPQTRPMVGSIDAPRSSLARGLVVGALVLAVAAAASADTFSDIRYTDLVARMGIAAPTGAGIGVGQVEAPEGTEYAPLTTWTDFTGTTFSLLSGTSTSWSSHANTVGVNLYGNTGSIAPGITSVFCWNVNSWAVSSYLRVGQGLTAPVTPPAGLRVFNHSWIGSFGTAVNDNDALRRLDFTVTRDNLLIVAGTNNGAGSAASPLMAYAYNGITVGLASGQHSNGLTPAGIDGPSRRKPDIVAPGDFTSFATPVVSAAGALLFDAALNDPATVGNSNASKALTLKAALLAGTTHRAGWSNGAPTSGVNRGFTGTPLDPVYGADLLNIDRSHLILTGGEVAGGATPNPALRQKHRGWDYIPTVAAGTSVFWTFRVHQPVAEASFLATWHRSVPTGFSTWNLQDFDLKLRRIANGVPTSLVGDAGIGVFASGNCDSVSTIDNAEHVFVRDLARGDYVLELARKAGTQTALPVAVAWHMPDTTPTPDLNADGRVDAADLADLLTQWGGTGFGDLNEDGTVDAADLSVILAAWSPV